MKTNLIDLYGVALQAPKISEDRKKAMITLKVARNLARGGQSEERSGYWDETSDFYYFTSSDIIGVWANLSKMRLDF